VSLLAARLLRTVSIAVCLVAILSFLLFALNQTSTASGQQQEALGGQAARTGAKPAAGKPSESGFRRTVDEVTEEVSSPVAGLSSSQWGERALRLFFVLALFGFALGYLARVIRVRA
jgi:hypothetical protein